MQIKFDGVSYSPSKVNIEGLCSVKDLSFETEDAGFIGIVGDRAGGRTTLLYLLSALLKPDSGHIFINGVDIHKKKKRGDTSLRCSFVMRGSDRVFCEKTVERELKRSLRGLELSSAEKKELILHALSLVGLDMGKTADISPACLSEAERYRLCIASAIIVKPDILLLDEPMSALDYNGKKMLLSLVGQLNSGDCQVFVSTNDVDFLAEYADYVLVMDKGRLIRSGSAKSVFVDYYDLIRNQIPVPSVKKAVQKLRERDINMPSNIVEYEQFVDRLKILMWRKQK